MSATRTDAQFRVLHALRVKGAATPDDVSRLTGLADAGAVLDVLAESGLATRRDAGQARYFALTREGSEQHAAAVAERLGADASARLGRIYDERFLPVNVTFKRLCAEWQAEERFELVEQAVDVHDEINSVLRVAADVDDRFGRYAARLSAAMDAFQEGDGDALVAPVGESYHNVWFELHEDLLVTLGRSRADEARERGG